jgi:hypothetical protein
MAPICSLKTLITKYQTKQHNILEKKNPQPVVPYEGETVSAESENEHRLRVFANVILRRIFGPKRQ